MKQYLTYPVKETEAANLRERILSDCNADAYILFLLYQEYYAEYEGMPSDVIASNTLNWTAYKVKRLRDKLYNAPTNYYHQILVTPIK